MGTRLDKRLYLLFVFTTFFVLNDARYPVQLSLPPLELLAPFPLPQNMPPYCVNHPPFAAQPPSTAVPTPRRYSPSPPSPPTPIFPIQSPRPSPPTCMLAPKPPPQYEPTPTCANHPPFAAQPPSAAVPTPRPYSPSPPSHPTPIFPIQSPRPSPPTCMLAPKPTPTPTCHGRSPPKHVPSSPFHQPPTVRPPPLPVPPPPHRKPQYAVWCVAKPTVPDAILQEALDYACGSGADCKSIQSNGPCFQPNTLLAHASYAFNSYWQNAKVAGGTCDFGGTAMLVTIDPSHLDCHFINS